MKSLGLHSLGSLYLDRNDPERAIQYLKEALQLKEEIADESGIAGILMLIGKVFDYTGLPDSALYYMEKGLKKRVDLNEVRGIASSQLNIGSFLIKLGSPGKAIEYLKSSRQNFFSLNDDTGVCIAIQSQAEALSALGEFQQAYQLATDALELARKLKNPRLISECYNIKALIFAADRQFDKAYEYKLLHEALSDSLADENKERIIRELEIKFQTARKTDEIKLLQSQNQLQRKNLLLLYVSVSGLLIFLILVLFLFRLRSADYQRKQKIFENEKTINEQENELKEKEQQLLKEQLEAKNRELASKALEMLRVNETIGDVIEKLESFGNGNSTTNDALSQQINSLISGLETQLKSNSWNEFEKIFNNIHSDFFQKILSVCPDLTPSEIKIAALLKLNLNSKEIAAITFKSEAGIKSIRYRLRKKLGLCSDDNLIPFLIKL
jgi:DNA-binding CsgD family transcriptional regulator/cell division protein FtsL